MAASYWSYFLLAVCGIVTLVLLTQPTQAEDINKMICDTWNDMAQQLTGSGRLQTCSNNKTKECTRIDCSGTISFSHPLIPGSHDHPFEIDYCIGSQLNSCTDPVSMDFYLQIPDRKFTRSLRIRQARDIELSDLSYDLGPVGKAFPVLDFEFDRTEQSTIKFSVKTKVKVASVTGSSIYIDQLERTLISEETIHAKSCANRSRDTHSHPPLTFAPDVKQCHPAKYQPHTPSPPREYSPSETLNKTCDTETKFCGENEVCDTSIKPAPRCACLPETSLSAKKDACLPLDTLNKPCRQIDDCGYNEECKSPAPGTQATCQCKHGYKYTNERHMCTFSQGGGQTASPGKVTPQPSSTNSTTAGHKVPGSGKSSDNDKTGSKAIALKIVGGALGGVCFVAAVVFVIIIVQRRRRRRLANPPDNTESSNPLLGNDDDDSDNMVM